MPSTDGAPGIRSSSEEPSKTKRLQAEAAFQDSRVRNKTGEARDKFMYLAQPVKTSYNRALTSLRGSTVVVVGCATGGVTQVARLGNRAIGVDISAVAIETLNKAIQKEGLQNYASAQVMDAEDLDLPPGSVDAVVCSGVLHHLDVEASCRSWSKVLKDDGLVFMVEPLAWNPMVAVFRFLTPSMRTRDEHPLVPRDFDTLRRYFRRVEFEACALTTPISLTFVYLPNIFGLRQKLHRVFTHIDNFLFRMLPFLKFFAWTTFIRCEGVRGRTPTGARLSAPNAI